VIENNTQEKDFHRPIAAFHGRPLDLLESLELKIFALCSADDQSSQKFTREKCQTFGPLNELKCHFWGSKIIDSLSIFKLKRGECINLIISEIFIIEFSYS